MTDVFSGVYDPVQVLTSIGNIIKPKGKLYLLENPGNYERNPGAIDMLQDSIKSKDRGIKLLLNHPGIIAFLLGGSYLKQVKNFYT